MPKNVALPNGTCHLCLNYGPLSYEHVPPEKAFNHHAVLVADHMRLFGSDWKADLENPSGETNQRGAGRHTLCEQCNSNTGSWYGGAYVDFVCAIMPVAVDALTGGTYLVGANIRPLLVLKQILVMFCSACGEGFAQKHPDLIRYLLNRNSRILPPKFDIYLGLYDRASKVSRQSGLSVRAHLNEVGGAMTTRAYAEIAFPPLVILMSLNSPSPDQRLQRVTWFNQYGRRERWQGTLALDCLQISSPYPGDFRSASQIVPRY